MKKRKNGGEISLDEIMRNQKKEEKS